LSKDYAIAARFTDEATSQVVLVAAGIAGSGTRAAGEFLTDEAALKQLADGAGVDWAKKNFGGRPKLASGEWDARESPRWKLKHSGESPAWRAHHGESSMDFPAARRSSFFSLWMLSMALPTQLRRRPVLYLPLLLFCVVCSGYGQSTAAADPGRVALERGDYSAAEAAYRNALRENPRSPELFTDLGISLQLQGRSTDAIHAFEQASEAQKLAAHLRASGRGKVQDP